MTNKDKKTKITNMRNIYLSLGIMVITVAFSYIHGVAVNNSGKTYKNRK